MSPRSQQLRAASIVVLLGMILMPKPGTADEVQPAHLDVPYEPTHAEVVDLMLQLANVTSSDYMIDMGCGDGRIVIAAARRFGARGLGIDLDPQRIRESTDNAAYAGVSHLAQFRRADIMKTPIADANVVTLYLLNEVNIMVRPKLFRELRPGTRVVSHAFHMGDWESDTTAHHPRARNKNVYLWIIPARVGGVWQWTTTTSGKDLPTMLRLDQDFQALRGTMAFSGPGLVQSVQASVRGREVTVTAEVELDGRHSTVRYQGTAQGDTIHGTQEWTGASGTDKRPWMATRQPLDVRGTWKLNVPFNADFNGLLYVGGDTHGLVAAYRQGQDGEVQEDLPLYLWGSSVRFSLNDTTGSVVFRGLLDQEAGEGLVYLDGWSHEPQWSVQRLSREVSAEVRLSSGNEESVPGAQVAGPVAMTSGTVSGIQSPGGDSVQSPATTGASDAGAVPNSTLSRKTEGPAAPPAPRRRWTPDMGAPQSGDEYVNPTDGSVLVWMPQGELMMGTDGSYEDERPLHKVAMAGFWLGQVEVTNARYARFMAAQTVSPPYYWNDSRYNQPDQPVVGVTWSEARRYCEWAGLRLPTEAEWEYAADAGPGAEYPTATGALSHALANTQGVGDLDKWEFASPVGSFPPNVRGLYDMAGNAWEWTSSAFSPYPYQASDGREDPEMRVLRVLRGGAWCFPSDYCRTKHRHRFAFHLRCDYAGIRVALTAPRAVELNETGAGAVPVSEKENDR